MFRCTLVYVHTSFSVILMGKRELVAFLGLSCWCIVIVVLLLLAVLRVSLQFVIVVFSDHRLSIIFIQVKCNAFLVLSLCYLNIVWYHLDSNRAMK